MKKKLALILSIILVLTTVTACGSSESGDENNAGADKSGSRIITDSLEREVEVPESVERIAPSGAIAEMVLLSLAPDKLVGLANAPSKEQAVYYPGKSAELPVFGQFYGKKSNLNLEALMEADPQLIVDIGEITDSTKEDIEAIEKQTGIPVLFIEGSLERMPSCYKVLGSLLGVDERAAELSAYIRKTVNEAQKKAENITEKVTVYYGTGPDGLACNAAGSAQADVLDLIGAENAIQVPENEITSKNGGTIISMEELYKADPDVIIVTDQAAYDSMSGEEWQKLSAVQTNQYYEIPTLPFCWMSGPPSVNRILGIWWLGYMCYPELYNLNMIAKTQEFYQLFWDYDMSEEEAEEMLQNSALKW